MDLKTQYQRLKSEIDEGILRVLDDGQYILDPQVAKLEEKLAVYTGATYCFTRSNGTDALQMFKWRRVLAPGYEVITPGFTYMAINWTVAHLGTKPVHVDI